MVLGDTQSGLVAIVALKLVGDNGAQKAEEGVVDECLSQHHCTHWQ
jgi:hypothetical protein